YHVAVTYDGTTFKLYVNGNLEGSRALVKTITYDSTIPWTIGSTAAPIRSQGFPRTWNGVIDEVNFNSRAMSASEIQTIFNQGISSRLAAPIVAGNNLIAGNYIGLDINGRSASPAVAWYKGNTVNGSVIDSINGLNGTPGSGVTSAAGEVGQAL